MVASSSRIGFNSQIFKFCLVYFLSEALVNNLVDAQNSHGQGPHSYLTLVAVKGRYCLLDMDVAMVSLSQRKEKEIIMARFHLGSSAH